MLDSPREHLARIVQRNGNKIIHAKHPDRPKEKDAFDTLSARRPPARLRRTQRSLTPLFTAGRTSRIAKALGKSEVPFITVWIALNAYGCGQ
jgi:hypothetical protein